nr:myrosinase 1-like [Leptinotarsa decemlineata]
MILIIGRKLYSVSFLFILIILGAVSASKDHHFPEGFLFGTASSAYQIEGGYNVEGKGPNIYDYYTKKSPNRFYNSSDGNIACDSFHKWREDVKLLKELGVDFYSFSISWSRVLPNGYSNDMNMNGLRYYNDLINKLIKNGIQPVVTMYQFDLPMALQELGGWTNPYIAYHFEDYANILFSYFGDRVKYWITLNADCRGYGDDLFPPFINYPAIANYLCQHVMLLAHAKVYHLYDNKFRMLQKGNVGITINASWYESYSSSPADLQAAEVGREFQLGSIMNPIFHTDGDYPKIYKERVDKISRLEGYLQSRLPVLSSPEVDYIQGTFDFVGLNVFKSCFVENATTNFSTRNSSVEKDMNIVVHSNELGNEANSDEMMITPKGVRNLLNWVKDKYDDPEIFITGNGFPDEEQKNDTERIEYLQKHLHAISEAIMEDRVNVKGYAVWSIMDSFEWTNGYRDKFGLYHVDFSDPNRKRTAKMSAKWFKKVIEERRIVGKKEVMS